MAFIGVILFILFFALLIFIGRKMPEWKGRYSEGLVHNEMQGLPDEYVIFNDLMFESNGRSTQIDHIVVSPYGVFVIETKGYKGWILGGENSEYWTQTIYQSKHKFYNPIKQNDGHVRFLRYLLKCNVDIPFIPIVVFNNDAELKVFVENHIVVNRCGLIEAIMQYRQAVLCSDTINWIVKTISESSVAADKEDKKRHKANVKRQQSVTTAQIQDGICPQCGGTLVLRHGKYDSFYGCSNYPNCKFTINR